MFLFQSTDERPSSRTIPHLTTPDQPLLLLQGIGRMVGIARICGQLPSHSDRDQQAVSARGPRTFYPEVSCPLHNKIAIHQRNTLQMNECSYFPCWIRYHRLCWLKWGRHGQRRTRCIKQRNFFYDLHKKREKLDEKNSEPCNNRKWQD